MGMQAAGVGPLVAFDDRSRRAREQRNRHVLGGGVTIALHAAQRATVLLMNAHEQNRVAKLARAPYQPSRRVAIKKATPARSPSCRRRRLTQKVAPPEAPKIAAPGRPFRNGKEGQEAAPTPRRGGSKSVFDKYRK